MKPVYNLTANNQEEQDLYFCWMKWNERPKVFNIFRNYDGNKLDEYFSEYLNFSITDYVNIDSPPYHNQKNGYFLEDLKIFVSYTTYRNNSECVVGSITFYHLSENVHDILEELEKFSIIEHNPEIIDQVNIFVLNITQDGFNETPIDLIYDYAKKTKLFYSKETYNGINDCISYINGNYNSIHVFTGSKGTGKSSIIHKIAMDLEKDVIYIPNTILENSINSPLFISYLQNRGDVVLFLDNCGIYIDNEHLINSILNLTEGILSEYISVNIIINIDGESIPNEIEDSNSFIDEVCFSELSKKETKRLKKHLGLVNNVKEGKLINILKGNKSNKIRL